MAKQRGRSSFESQTVLGAVPLGVKQRPGVPAAFKDNSPEADMWRSIVSAETPDWFNAGDLPLLEAFCRATINYRKVTLQCTDAPFVVIGGHNNPIQNPIYRVQDTLSKQMAQLASKLRLAQSSRVTGHQAASKARNNNNNNPTESGLKPWQRAA